MRAVCEGRVRRRWDPGFHPTRGRQGRVAAPAPAVPHHQQHLMDARRGLRGASPRSFFFKLPAPSVAVCGSPINSPITQPGHLRTTTSQPRVSRSAALTGPARSCPVPPRRCPPRLMQRCLHALLYAQVAPVCSTGVRSKVHRPRLMQLRACGGLWWPEQARQRRDPTLPPIHGADSMRCIPCTPEAIPYCLSAAAGTPLAENCMHRIAAAPVRCGTQW